MPIVAILFVLWVLSRRRAPAPTPVPVPVPVPVPEPVQVEEPLTLGPTRVEEPAALSPAPVEEPPALSPAPVEEAPALSPVPTPRPPPPLLAVDDVAQCVSCGNVVRRFDVLERDFAHFGPDGPQVWFYLLHELGPNPLQADFWAAERNAAGQQIERAISPRVPFSTSTITAYLEHIGFSTSQAAIDSVRTQLQPDSGNAQFQPGGGEYETLYVIRGVFP